MRKKIIVTGATGRTGSLVLKKLRASSDEFEAIGFARSQTKAEEIFGTTEDFCFGDIKNKSELEQAFQGCDGLVILTSSMLKIKAPPPPGERPEYVFETGEMPEQIDYQGQKNQIDAAKKAGIKQIVSVGSMGGTQENHFLNQIGNGKLLIWKRKAEEYLINSGIAYTIIHPGGLIDQPGGYREFIVGKADNLLLHSPTSIPREDVA